MSILPSARTDLTGPTGGTLSDVVGLILDKGLVIDIYVRVSLVGIEALTIDARMVIASVETYLRFAEAAQRLDLEAHGKPGLPDVLGGVAGGLTGLIHGAAAGGNAAGELGQAAEPAQMPTGTGDRQAADRPGQG
jgi:hypothetical protein